MTGLSLIVGWIRDPELRSEIVSIGVEIAVAVRARRPEPAIIAHQTRAEYAQRSGVSDATVSRWVAQGMPTMPVGTTYRIDPIAADAWRRERPRKATTPEPNSTKRKGDAHDDLDVSGSLRAAGLAPTRTR